MNDLTLINTLEVNNSLGECILWQPEEQCLWWTDIQSCRLFRYQASSGVIDRWSTPERLCAFGFIENSDDFIAAFESGLAIYSPFNGQLEWLARPVKDYQQRFNDGRVDRQGRFWSGTMMENAADESDSASLYCLDRNVCAKRETGIEISNSLCWSPDGDVMYFADSPKQQIYAYNFAAGALSNRRTFATTKGEAAPDGSTVDAEGYLWNAQWGGRQVVRYTPAGEIDKVLKLPVSQPTCVAFGGPELNWLCVSTARLGLSARQLQEQPEAGNVFIYDSPFKGLEECRFKPAEN